VFLCVFLPEKFSSELPEEHAEDQRMPNIPSLPPKSYPVFTSEEHRKHYTDWLGQHGRDGDLAAQNKVEFPNFWERTETFRGEFHGLFSFIT